MKPLYFVPECHADTAFVRAMYFNEGHRIPGDDYQHASGTPWVKITMERAPEDGPAIVAFIDNDAKHTPNYFKEFQLVNLHPRVQFKKHRLTERYLVVVDPAIERFLMAEAQDLGIRLQDYGLPEDFKQLRKVLKSTHANKNEGFLNLLQVLVEKTPAGVAFIQDQIMGLR